MMLLLNKNWISMLVYGGKSLKCQGSASFFVKQKRDKSDVHVPEDQMKESSAPSPSWPKEAVQLYSKLIEETSNGEWEKVHRQAVKGEVRPFLRASGDNMFMAAVFTCKSTLAAMGVITFGPWCEGAPGYVHGGAIATVHDSITGILANKVVGPSVTVNLNVNFRELVRLKSTALLTAKVDSVDGRKISLTSKLMSPDEKVVYGDASALYLLPSKLQ